MDNPIFTKNTAAVSAIKRERGSDIKGANTKPIGAVALTILLLLLTGALRLVQSENLLIKAVCFLLVFTIYIGMLALWSLAIGRRMMHGHVRRYLLGIAALMLFWIFVRTLKHHPFSFIDPAARFLWYCFYIPMVLIPLFSFFAALCLGKPESWRPVRAYNLLFIPAAVLMLGVLTNDVHQLAFRFAPGYVDWGGEYTYGVVYYLVALWMAGLLLSMVFLLFQKSHIPHTKKRVWMPIAVMGIAVLYSILYAIDQSKTGFGFIEMTAMFCALAAGLWESCIHTGLLPSNTRYGAFFDASPLAAQVVGANGHIFYSSRLAKPVLPILFGALKQAGSFRPDENTALHASPIRGGYVVWREDVSHLSRLIGALRDAGDELQDGVEILTDELAMKSRRLHVEEQNRLYDLTLLQTMPQLEKIRRHLDTAAEADTSQKLDLLRKINVLGVYIKRRANLVLMAEERETVTVEELARCFHESFESLRAGGARCALAIKAGGGMDPAHAVLFYDFFGEVAEAAFPAFDHLFVTLADADAYCRLSMEIESGIASGGFPDAHWRAETIKAMRGRLECAVQGESLSYIALWLPKGGEVR